MYIAYVTLVPTKTTKLIYSDNAGVEFKPVLNLNKNDMKVANASQGLAVCSDKGKNYLASMVLTKENLVEYSVLRAKDMVPHYKPNSYTPKIDAVVTDCSLDEKTGLMRVTSIASVWDRLYFYIYFAQELDTPPA